MKPQEELIHHYINVIAVCRVIHTSRLINSCQTTIEWESTLNRVSDTNCGWFASHLHTLGTDLMYTLWNYRRSLFLIIFNIIAVFRVIQHVQYKSVNKLVNRYPVTFILSKGRDIICLCTTPRFSLRSTNFRILRLGTALHTDREANWSKLAIILTDHVIAIPMRRDVVPISENKIFWGDNNW